MLSRTADALYWIGRYTERAENGARLLDVHLHLAMDPHAGVPAPWKALVGISGDLLRFLERYDATSRETILEFLTFDAGNPNAILSCLRAARENARACRDTLSSPLWERLNETALEASEAAAKGEAPAGFFADLRRAGRLLEILADDTMLHDEAWHFLRLGRLIERADKVSRILDLPHWLPGGTVERVEDVAWSAALQSGGGLELYRRRHGRLRAEGAIDFLLLDREFPRSVHASLSGAEASLHALTGTPPDGHRNDPEQRLGQLRAELAFARAEEVAADGLHGFLDAFQLKLNLASDAVTEALFPTEPLEIGEVA
jgi:uncharacterized alpha-E superfamily protein